MAAPWSPTTLVRVDHGQSSRFGSYASARVGELFEEDRTDPAMFSAWAWSVGTLPVMSPGYVDSRPDLSSVRLNRDENGDLVVELVLPLSHHALAKEVRPSYEVGDWDVNHFGYSGHDPQYAPVWAPARVKRAAVLVAATLLVPARDWDLFVPSGHAEQLVDDAQQAVQYAVRNINSYVGPYVADLLGESR
ncbi:hypothetical protein ACFYWP_37145 [Actinacidiphila glaucinigra]|uniref:hypothetical protein n=1 Tax=Actinacidiphila glaucinigra TaxID=235986 RepID=UPI00367EB46F